MVAIEWCGRMCRYRLGVCLCLSSAEQSHDVYRRAPPGGGTHGPVIISTGRSQEMHFTRSNSFLEDKQVSSQELAGSRAWGGVN